MIRSYLVLGMVSLMASGAAFAETEKFHSETDVQREADGSYRSAVTSDLTETDGTRRKIETTEKASKGKGGDSQIAFRSKESTDPRGLMNKKTSSVEVKEEKAADGTATRKGYARSVDDAGTTHIKKTETSREVRNDGTARDVIKEKKVTDPKGLMNKKTVESERVVDHNDDGTTTTHSEREVDGETVRDRTVTE